MSHGRARAGGRLHQGEGAVAEGAEQRAEAGVGAEAARVPGGGAAAAGALVVVSRCARTGQARRLATRFAGEARAGERPAHQRAVRAADEAGQEGGAGSDGASVSITPASFNRHAARNGLRGDADRRSKARKGCVGGALDVRALRGPVPRELPPPIAALDARRWRRCCATRS